MKSHVFSFYFQEPSSPEPWQDVRAAKEPGPKCLQYIPQSFKTTGVEDCLYLNIFTPKVKTYILLFFKICRLCTEARLQLFKAFIILEDSICINGNLTKINLSINPLFRKLTQLSKE